MKQLEEQDKLWGGLGSVTGKIINSFVENAVGSDNTSSVDEIDMEGINR